MNLIRQALYFIVLFMNSLMKEFLRIRIIKYDLGQQS